MEEGVARLRVLFLPLGIDGAGCYRCVFPALWLTDRGWDATIPRFVIQDGAGQQVPPLPLPGLLAVRPGNFKVGFVDEKIEGTDVLVVHAGSEQFMGDWAAKYQAAGVKLVVDLDDDLHRVPSYNPGRLDPDWSPSNNRRNTQRLVERADAVTVATPELARFYGRWNANVTVLPNRLHWPMWAPLPPVYEREDWRRVRIGYLGNMDFHGEDLRTIAPSLRKWLVAHPDVDFVAAGDPRIHEVIGVPEAQRVSTSKVWFRNMDLPYIVSTLDVGLAPLVRNDFNEGKSCLKGMEYNACGIPVLASPTEDYRRWVTDGENGFLCRHPKDFIGRLDELVADAELRRTMGAKARAAAEAASFQHHIGDWEGVYAGLCDHPQLAGTRVAA